ncbi:MAG: zinc finger, CDGSH-type domain protein [Micrococcaceae bacterium]|jgi:CDGSH-type Zn-finger protein|nr:zinc finger, CDGSH-type domain protein [Micrococcaceae bacterium]
MSNLSASEDANAIVVCPDGPILVRGDFEIVSTTGEPLPRTRRTVALCRCGASTIKPYCDGTHKLINFRTEFPADPEKALPDR